jgi:hypothetical protein
MKRSTMKLTSEERSEEIASLALDIKKSIRDAEQNKKRVAKDVERLSSLVAKGQYGMARRVAKGIASDSEWIQGCYFDAMMMEGRMNRLIAESVAELKNN